MAKKVKSTTTAAPAPAEPETRSKTETKATATPAKASKKAAAATSTPSAETASSSASRPATPGLDSKLLGKAIKSLLEYEQKKEDAASSSKLLGSYAKPVFLQLQLKNEIKETVVRPVRIAIPNGIFSSGGEGHNICLFVRSEDKEAIEKQLNDQPIEGVDKVLSINDVKKLYAPHKEKKALLGAYTHFLCDARIMGHLYNLLGKVFGARNHYPVPIEYNNPTKIGKAVALFKDSTYMHLRGSNISIRFGHTKQSAAEIVRNVEVGLAFAVQKLKNEWRDVLSVHVKSSDSPALPVYSKLPNSEEFQFVQKELGKISDAAVSKKAANTASSKKDKVVSEAAGAVEAPIEKKRKLKTVDAEASVPSVESSKGGDKKQPKKKAAVAVAAAPAPAAAQPVADKKKAKRTK
jgi:ribosome biogenesis protein UTP30